MPLPLFQIALLPISAASGLVALEGMFWTVADDETELIGSGSHGGWNERIALVSDRLSADPVERKRRKPDFESIAVLPDDRLFVLGSGSTPARRRGVVVDVRSRDRQVIDLSALFRALAEEIAELNVEGAVIHANALFLAQRGIGARTADPRAQSARAGNALVRLDLGRVLESLGRGGIGAEAVEAILPVELPSIDGVPLGLTDLASNGSDLFFAAAAEDTASTYADGACLGSAIGRLSLAGSVTAIRSLDGREKIEGLAVSRSGIKETRAWLVSDPDDRSVSARFFRIDALGLG